MNSNNLDGYIVPKNDEFFTEYSKINKLEIVANFSGSAGFILILKNSNHLFVDGRYTIQAKQQSGKNFKIREIPYEWPKDILENDARLNIGFDPKLFTTETLKIYFNNSCNLFPLDSNLFRTKAEINARKGKPLLLQTAFKDNARLLYRGEPAKKHQSRFNVPVFTFESDAQVVNNPAKYSSTPADAQKASYWKRIVNLTKLIVFSRKGYDRNRKDSVVAKYLNNKKITYIKNKIINISSSSLRRDKK